MPTEIVWETDEPREWRAKGQEKLHDHVTWESCIKKLSDRRYVWSLIDRRYGYVEVRGEETSADASKAAVLDSLARNHVAFRTDSASGWPEAVRQLFESSQKLLHVTESTDPGFVAAARDEYRAACEAARRLLVQ